MPKMCTVCPLGMIQNPESVPFVRRDLQFSRPDDRRFTLTRHAEIVNRCAYSSSFFRCKSTHNQRKKNN